MGRRGIGAYVPPKLVQTDPARLKPPTWEKKRGLTRAARVIRFLEYLPVTKGKLAGTDMKLLPSQRDFIETIYGPDGDKIRIGVLSEPRGNGKTGLVAGLMLCHLLGPESEPRGACYSAGTDRKMAAIIFEEMCAILIAVPDLRERANIVRFNKKIEVMSGPGSGSIYEALSADARRAHGLAPSFWCYDELAQAHNRILLDNLMTAMGKRQRSLGLIISTQAAEDSHPLSEIIDDGLSGLDPTVAVRLIAAPMDADPFDPDVIASVNPAFGKFLDRATVMAEAAKAKRLPSFESAFRNLRLNQRVAGHELDRLISREVWAEGNGPIDEEIFRDGRPVYAGLDLSGRLDLTAVVFAAADDDGVVHLKPIAWTPFDTLAERTTRDRAPYDAWARSGVLQTTPGKVIDYEFVAYQMVEMAAEMHLARVYFDRWRIEIFKKEVNSLGAILPLSPCGQGYKDIVPCIEAFEALVVEGKIRHGNHPVMNWCFGNAVATRDAAGNRKLDKAKSNGRIDLALASIMAIGAMKVSTEQEIDLAGMIG